MRSMSTANIIDLEDDISYLHFLPSEIDNYKINLTYRYVRRCSSNRPTIIFIHDCRVTKDSWNNIMNNSIMQTNYVMYSLDMRGYGKSPCGKEEHYNINNLVEDIYNFITFNNINKIILIGEGSGARLVSEFCRQHYNSVIAAVLYNLNLDTIEIFKGDSKMLERLKLSHRIHNYYEQNEKGEENPLHYRSAKDELKRCGYTDKEIEYLFSEDGCHYVDNVIDLVHYSVVIGLHPLADYMYEMCSQIVDVWTYLNNSPIPVMIVQIENSKYDFTSIHLRKIRKLDNISAVSIKDYGDIWPVYNELINNTTEFIEKILEKLKEKELIEELW
eukprot:TRINITY_DN1460_c0_g3_i1.p1 TRINITY_DN1460_c0_g3~~TRINITY_DN1460_c0_g3_i1.p1  ORF type:complete len:330 (+),score=33.30 TRINITY_DN1460_c0_g3_i1:43-1032(+)